MALIKCKECGKDVSSKIKNCPHCGAPIKKESILTKKIGCGLFLLFLISIFIICTIVKTVSKSISQPKTEQVKKITGVKCAECEEIFSAETTKVSMLSTLTKGKDFVFDYKDTLCEGCVEQRKIDAEKLYQEGRKVYRLKDYTTAKQKFTEAIRKGHKNASAWLKKTNDKILAIQKIEKEKAEIATRKAYAKLARESFLDMGRDIKVRVHGSKYKYITFTYVLMGDVFVHKFEKSPMFQEIYRLGFRRVYYKDGYNYSKYTYWKDK